MNSQWSSYDKRNLSNDSDEQMNNYDSRIEILNEEEKQINNRDLSK